MYVLRGGTIQSGRETWLDDAAATPRRVRERVLTPGPMGGSMSGPSTRAPHVPSVERTSHHGRYRRHVDLLRVTSAACPR